jgi:hypothetical protein
MRLEVVSPEPLVVYYHLKADDVIPLGSLTQLEGVFQDQAYAGGPPDASEIKVTEHFHAIMKAREDSRIREREAAVQHNRFALVQAARTVLMQAALCDIGKFRHATLFDEDLMTAGFDMATVLRQGKKGFPFSELLSWINPNELLKPSMNDPFWTKVEGKSQQRIQEIEKAVTEEGSDLIRKWTEMGGTNAVETVIPKIVVRRYFMRDQKEKPRLTLVIAPLRKDRFTRYLPFYSMKSAFEKFVHGKDEGEEGWMEVEIGKKLHKSMFVMRIEGKAMEPLLSDGHFAVFDGDIRGSIDGAILFVYGKDICDPNLNSHLTVRRLGIVITDAKTGAYREVILEPLHPDFQRFQLKKLEEGAFHVIARYVCGV